MINIRHSKDCCGCSACIDICPHYCISQVVDKDGYVKPAVDKSQCVDCRLCEKVCPELNTVHLPFDKRQLYSAYHKDDNTRSHGSSGSVFAALAQYVFSKGGIVFGAAFDEYLQLKHQKAESMQELRPLMRSKYLQSNTKGIFLEIKKELQNDRLVLFVGTPCQTNAIYNYISPTQKKNLILVDFICHGVPSQSFFNKSIRYYEEQNKVKISDISFHTKLNGLYHSFEIHYTDIEGNVGIKRGPYQEFPFYLAFKKYITFRDSCYHCRHTGVERASDMTIGDFWGICSLSSEVSKEEFAKGFSEIVVNTPNGGEILEKLHDSLVLKQFDVRYAGFSNPSYLKCVKEDKWKLLFRFLNRCFPYSITEKILFRK